MAPSSPTKRRKKDTNEPQVKMTMASKKRTNIEKGEEPSLPILLGLLFAFFMIVCLFTGLRFYLQPYKGSILAPVDLFADYVGEIRQIKHMYDNQTDLFWKTILSGVRIVLSTENPESPAIIMVVIPSGNHQMALCLAQHMAQTLNRLLGSKNPEDPSHAVVDVSSLGRFKTDEQKWKIDEQIRAIVDDGQRTVIISGLEDIHPETLIVFHQFCDDLEAVYKNIAMIFLLEVPPEEHVENDSDVHSHLSSLWGTLNQSAYRVLMAQMASNIAILTAKDDFMGC